MMCGRVFTIQTSYGGVVCYLYLKEESLVNVLSHYMCVIKLHADVRRFPEFHPPIYGYVERSIWKP